MNRLVLVILVSLVASGCKKNDPFVGPDMATGPIDLIEIPKTDRYNGEMDYPGIPPCNDTGNDSTFDRANVIGDGITRLLFEICPVHDEDFFLLTVDAGSCARVFVRYPISYGDLDLAIYDKDKNATEWFDGDATHDDACVIIPPQAKNTDYYAIVTGAVNQTVNRYYITLVEQSADAGSECTLTCPNASRPPDMAQAQDAE